MDTSVLELFLTKENITDHFSYLKGLRLRYSILEKSIPEIKGKSVCEIYRMRIKQEIKNEILPLINSIICHKIYFSSFSERPATCSKIKELYISEPSFLYELYEIGRSANGGFLLIGRDGVAPRVTVCSDFSASIPSGVCLALDLCEHAYFLDYRFAKEKYLKAMLQFLNLSRLYEEKATDNYFDAPV
ncbi:MAG: hypothetical protein J6Q85_01640 [Clostridia bacterium]|nr:hypothetical protein [Clostridia bacterium]